MASGKIFFFHNPKAAGSSIRSILRTQFGDSEICPIIENDEVGHLANKGSYDRYKGFALYAGHYGVDIFSATSDGHMPITNFRRPVDRLVSVYRYFRTAISLSGDAENDPRYVAVVAAKKMAIDDFLLSDLPEILLYTQNLSTAEQNQASVAV